MGKTSPAAGVTSKYILLSDIVSSSRLLEQFPREYDAVLNRHNGLIEQTVVDCGGEIFKNTGDGYYAFFDSSSDCLDCASKLAAEFTGFPAFAENEPFMVRIVLHQGEIKSVGGDYLGPALNRASRLCQVCYPGQVLLSHRARPESAELPPDVGLTYLGEHYLRDLAEPERLYQLDIPGLRRSFPALPTLANRPNNLVAQPNTFIGRERELTEIEAMLLGDRRLITITGPGGYGKSRLTAHLCADMLYAFDRGVFFIELAPVRDHHDIPATVASALGFQFYGNRDPRDQLIDYLREKELLLCFDNFEHLLEGASFVSDVLREAPKIKATVTSREPLRISGEQVYRLDPLPVGNGRLRQDAPVPLTEHVTTHLDHSPSRPPDAVLLFADRAALVNSTFTLTEQNRDEIQELCARLDGIPLAIELAAAWMDSFTAHELHAEFTEQLELVARLSDLPDRHRSLRASLDWSWGLLSLEQQELLMALSVFRNGSFADAISAVTGKRGLSLRQELSRLIDKSWVSTREVAGQTRYFMRDTASYEYAQGKLFAVAGDNLSADPASQSILDSLFLAHARFYSELMAAEGEKLHQRHQAEALRLIGLELQNISVAWDSLVDQLRQGGSSREAASLLLPLARWLWEYLDMTSAHLGLVNLYEPLQSTARQLGNLQLLIWALLGCSQGLRRLGNSDRALEYAIRALELSRESGDRFAIATALNCLGVVEYMQSDYEAAGTRYEESLALRRVLGDSHGISQSLNNLGALKYIFGDPEAARSMYNESLDIKRVCGDRNGTAITLHNLGMIEGALGNHDPARSLYNESLDIKRELGDRSGIATTLNALGILERNSGHYDLGRAAYSEALSIFREIGNRSGIPQCLNNLGSVEHNQGNLAEARELYTEALAIFREVGERGGISFSSNALGVVECLQGNYLAARKLFTESLETGRDTGNRRVIALSSTNLGTVEHLIGDHAAAARLYTEALVIRREIGHRGEIGESLAAAGGLLAAAGRLEAAAVCLYGTRHQETELELDFDVLERQFLEQGLAAIEHPESGLPPTGLAQAADMAKAMSIDELADAALEALNGLERTQHATL